MAQRQEQFQQEAYQSMQKAQQDAMAPIYKKLDDAIPVSYTHLNGYIHSESGFIRAAKVIINFDYSTKR